MLEAGANEGLAGAAADQCIAVLERGQQCVLAFLALAHAQHPDGPGNQAQLFRGTGHRDLRADVARVAQAVLKQRVRRTSFLMRGLKHDTDEQPA